MSCAAALTAQVIHWQYYLAQLLVIYSIHASSAKFVFLGNWIYIVTNIEIDGLNSVRYRRNKVAHPDVKLSSAISILKNDFGAPFAYLYADALRLANFLFDN